MTKGLLQLAGCEALGTLSKLSSFECFTRAVSPRLAKVGDESLWQCTPISLSG